MRFSTPLFLLCGLVLAGYPRVAEARKACKRHGGVASCDPSHQVVCQDGTIDKEFQCFPQPKGKPKVKRWKRELKMKPPTDRGQISKPGETPATDTLEESYREMTK